MAGVPKPGRRPRRVEGLTSERHDATARYTRKVVMPGPAYTLARWYVKEGREADFVNAWSGDLGDYFLTPPGCRWGTPLQSTEDAREFYSFGLWDSLDDILNMRSDPRTREVFGVLSELWRGECNPESSCMQQPWGPGLRMKDCRSSEPTRFVLTQSGDLLMAAPTQRKVTAASEASRIGLR